MAAKKDVLAEFGKKIPRRELSQFQDGNDKVNWGKVLSLIYKLIEIEIMKMKRWKRFLVMFTCIIPIALIVDGFYNLIILSIYNLF